MKRWIVSDLHFGHTNIIKYSNRPFTDLDDMERQLIANWNSVVGVDDVVYFLGDFAMGQHSMNRDTVLCKSLNGTKHMIVGNHDFNFKSTNKIGERIKVMRPDAKEYWETVGFTTVSENPIILDDYFILSHGPINGMNRRQIMANIHGHTHDVSLADGNYFNACVEMIGYTPVDFDTIKEYFSGKN